jgi:acetyltransferase-like isoleucine patch superfamily enzyme
VLLGGTNIGDYAILGAGSVVSFEIPPYAIAVGNPARVIKRRPNAPPLPAAASPDTAE